MATLSDPEWSAVSDKDVDAVKRLLWGPEIKSDVFRRWTQGLDFSEDEPTALVQFEGGPCAVLAPLQAFVLKNAMFADNAKNDWRNMTETERNALLCQALADMLFHISNTGSVCLVQHHLPTPHTCPSPSRPSDPSCTPQSTASTSDNPTSESRVANSSEGERIEDASSAGTSTSDSCSPKKRRLCHEDFHSGLRCRKCHSHNVVQSQLQQSLTAYHREYGVLLVLYSVILTKGLEQIQQEMEDPTERMIDSVHGHGSQSLINLLISGSAVSNIWDNEKDLTGLKLRGIKSRSAIGFLTQMEYLRYCEVGWNLKNPLFPIWLLGSETHLSVLFSQERKIVSPENPGTEARQMFNNFDTENGGFIQAEHLQDLMSAVDLVSDPEYVKIMREKLDPEVLGIITLNSFMEEFYPSDSNPDLITSFNLLHYNGQARSCPNNKVQYTEGQASISEFPDTLIVTENTPIKTCLMTKWPTINLQWTNDALPSLN